ncbi:LacI family DNA-binding transcriptional regulator [Rathayibacter sp. YIM 133350]|uniref:LacI family DNA-binding transcriptional regulator n=1 Tax=Rathayibacter sp. YIM 133350 TaxID=3131992 RepID=UPI00307CE5C4
MTTEQGTAHRRVTLKDVAARAGVATSTVSKVMNGRHDVGPEVRQRVLDTVQELGFHPNSVARGLRMQRSDTIAIITDDLEGIFTNAMMRGVEDAASDAGVGVLLCNSYGDAQRESLQLQRLLDKQVDALIFMSGNRVGERPEPALPPSSQVPYVYLYEYGLSDVPSVLPDDAGGAAAAARHLVDSGAGRIAFLNGPLGWEATEDRYAGFTTELTRLGRELDPDLYARTGSWNPEDGYSMMKSFLGRRPDIDAVFCGSDDLATGVMAAVYDAGRSIPSDVQVVGFDDRSLAIHQRPPLTTVALPLAEMGRIAGKAALDLVLGEDPGFSRLRVPCTLVARGTTHS